MPSPHAPRPLKHFRLKPRRGMSEDENANLWFVCGLCGKVCREHDGYFRHNKRAGIVVRAR